ncbi:related to SVF1 - protein with a potential role in cell survival pathways [Melanopsichium pennsylvanicum]|uniref:Related to SVF1 - protein with a potential role in cell survival pathways n=2 Tax=Melanopsichium pennsylvanicum TaxID=63383 RepID=A0AAJ4XRN7_9BASI|nr:oxidative stress survival svf1-like protein [Melanopsichium pennsylvanicum 4]SNX87620.1 related to SVF1 - protein with a potential role in cell survival pathways [Melanopsichium pennsylvanicum]
MSWGSWLKGDAAAAGSGTAAASSSNFHAITDSVAQDSLFGPLEPTDLEWTCAGGFTTETQTWYSVLEDGSFATSQIIHSAVGLWYPQVQMTFKYFNPKTGKKIWKSINVTKFAAQTDKRSSKAAEFTVLFSTTEAGQDKYTITANLDTDLQISWSFVKPASVQGWKLGAGPKGGFSYFGSNLGSPEGYVIHRFWPVAESEGHVISQGNAIDAKGHGMFVHAIQGMRPNLVAAKWNFANFQAQDDKLGRVSGVMMEFTTTPDYGSVEGTQGSRQSLTVNIGSIVAEGKLVTVTASTRAVGQAEGEKSKQSNSYVKHLDKTLDQDTGYQAPQAIKYHWQGPLLDLSSGKGDVAHPVEAELKVDLGKPYPSSETHGLVDKVDVLAEIPYMVRKLVNYVAGTKPYIYQTLNDATLKITLPEQYEGTGKGDSVEVKGSLFEEHTFISG